MQSPEEILAGIQGELAGIFELLDWAEDEIAAAQRRYPEKADLLYHAFTLLTPGDSGNNRWGREFVYRAFCRELLERVAKGEDTQPGTDAEMILACNAAGSIAPMNTAGAGLYFRLWYRAGFPDLGMDNREHYEALERSAIDDLENTLRRKLARKDRKLGEIKCSGMHHGEEVKCAYAVSDNRGPVRQAGGHGTQDGAR